MDDWNAGEQAAGHMPAPDPETAAVAEEDPGTFLRGCGTKVEAGPRNRTRLAPVQNRMTCSVWPCSPTDTDCVFVSPSKDAVTS